MLQSESRVKVGDNSGVLQVRVINVIGKTKRRFARIGDMVLVTSRRVRASQKKGVMYTGLVANTCSPFRRQGEASSIKFKENAVLLLKKEKKGWSLLGNRVNVAVPKELLGLLSQKDRSKVSFVV